MSVPGVILKPAEAQLVAAIARQWPNCELRVGGRRPQDNWRQVRTIGPRGTFTYIVGVDPSRIRTAKRGVRPKWAPAWVQ